MINRHNYEEFFLMYVDDELNPAQRAAVELFVQQNPDLANELDMLQQAKLPLVEETFAFDKNMLLKNAGTIGMDNYEEYFLLYIDNELSAAQKETVEKFVLQHPQLQEGFTLLEQTVLEQEAIVFEDKESLLRKEERRIIPLFIRIAVAAAVVGVIALAWWFIAGTKQNEVNNFAGNKKPAQNNNSTVTTVPDKKEQQPATIAQQPPQPANEVPAPLVKQQTVNNNKEVASSTNNGSKQKKEQTQQLQHIQTTVPEIAVVNTQNKNSGHTTAVSGNNTAMQNIINVDPIVAQNNSKTNNATTVNDQQQNTTVSDTKNNEQDIAYNDNNLIQPASYKELNTDEDDKQHAVYVGSIELNKNAVRGFMKKVGGFLSGKKNESSKSDGKLQVANLELNTN